MKKIIHFFRGDVTFSISFLLAAIAIFFGRFSVADINFKTIVTLSGLMLVINGLDYAGILGHLSSMLVRKSVSLRALIRSIILLSFFGAMFLTNDVTILTLLPLYLRITKTIKKRPSIMLGAALIIPAANLGSSLFPFGNPHNLFLYSLHQMSLFEFFQATGLLSGSALILLMLTVQLIPKEILSIELPQQKADFKKTLIFSLLMVVMIAGVFNQISYWLALLIVVAAVLFVQPKLFKKIDYRLLATFAFFFIIVGNIKQLDNLIEWLHSLMTSPNRTLFTSLLTSQVISNVPSTLLLAHFTHYHQALVLGADIGGLGTLVASMANLIGHKIIRIYAPQEQKLFNKYFYQINIAYLLLLILIVQFVL
ncbi:MAG TPA: SLC13 family permease [Tetragenococcus sp.]|nr:SLC13 family permease [Tetragenococcus sp.]